MFWKKNIDRIKDQKLLESLFKNVRHLNAEIRLSDLFGVIEPKLIDIKVKDYEVVFHFFTEYIDTTYYIELIIKEIIPIKSMFDCNVYYRIGMNINGVSIPWDSSEKYHLSIYKLLKRLNSKLKERVKEIHRHRQCTKEIHTKILLERAMKGLEE